MIGKPINLSKLPFNLIYLFFLIFCLSKVEAEKSFHLRLAATLDDVEAEVSLCLPSKTFSKCTIIHFLMANFCVDELWKATKRFFASFTPINCETLWKSSGIFSSWGKHYTLERSKPRISYMLKVLGVLFCLMLQATHAFNAVIWERTDFIWWRLCWCLTGLKLILLFRLFFRTSSSKHYTFESCSSETVHNTCG